VLEELTHSPGRMRLALVLKGRWMGPRSVASKRGDSHSLTLGRWLLNDGSGTHRQPPGLVEAAWLTHHYCRSRYHWGIGSMIGLLSRELERVSSLWPKCSQEERQGRLSGRLQKSDVESRVARPFPDASVVVFVKIGSRAVAGVFSKEWRVIEGEEPCRLCGAADGQWRQQL